MGAFTGLRDAKRGFASNPLQPGKVVVRIDRCEMFDSDKGEFWKNTLTVLAVSDGPHKVGEVVHTFFKYTNTAEMREVFQRNLKAFIANVLDVDDELVDESVAKKILDEGEKSDMIGLVTVVTARSRTSKKSKDEKTGEPFEYTVYSWEPSLDEAAIKDAIGEAAYKQFFPNG